MVKVYKDNQDYLMVKIQHSGDNRDKIDFIISTAQNRFGLYGLEKTTMREIAGDAGMSKASLYYYFPDKTSLFHAVIEKEQEDFFRYLDESRCRLETAGEMLRDYVNIRNLYFRKFINLSKLRLNAIRELKPVMRDLIDELKTREMNYIRNIIRLGKENSGFRELDEEEVASVFLESLQAIRRSFLWKNDLLGVEAADLEVMEKRMDVFLTIFINGIARDHANVPGKK